MSDRKTITFEARGRRFELRWLKSEYRAYILDSGKWYDISLGSGVPDSLIEYIKNNKTKGE